MEQSRGKRVVTAIGVFDGIHLGHQVLIERTMQAARGAGADAAVVTFDPPPVAFFAPPDEPFQITPRREKTALLEALGIERVWVLPFTAELAAHTARQFVTRILQTEVDLAGVVIGHDFSFGAHREGSARMMRALGSELGFSVEVVDPVEVAGRRVSSTRIRTCIRCGAVEQAARLLGRLMSVTGRVGAGTGIGGDRLVPTANLEVPPDQLLPPRGVYAVVVEAEGERFAGVANLGAAPTLGTGHARLLEVHLLDYRGDLRGKELRVGFAEWLRETRRFADLERLRGAIEADIRAVRKRLDRSDWARAGEMRLVRTHPV
jgi:riboflavin kinase/FMN adenylyltransferase